MDVMPAVIGRVGELAQLDAMLDAARRGDSGALVIRGEPGVGKSTLLEAVAERARDFRVLRALGVESESDLAFSGLLELLRPALDHVGGLPEGQSRALESALALGDGEVVERFAVYAATLGLLAAAAEERRLLCVVDDAQWLDPSSREALLFATRRLSAEGVVMLFGARDGEAVPFEARGVPQRVLTGLPADDARRLVEASSAEAIAPGVVAALVTATGGNPLALVEIPAMLREGQRLGAEPLDDPLRGGAAVERAFGARAKALSPEAQRVLLIAAVSDSLELSAITTAAGVDADGLDEAEAAGLIAVGGERIGFRHPLVRSAIHAAATSGERRAAHAALAAALHGVDEDRATWHRAASTVGRDELVATDLERVAEGARRRGGAESEARLLDRAARLTPEPERRAERLCAAGMAAFDAGRVDYAAALLDEGLALAAARRLRANLLDGRVEVARVRGEIAAFIPACSEEAEQMAEHDPARAARLLFHVWDFYAEQDLVVRSRQVLDRMLALSPDAVEDRVLLAHAWQAMMEDEIAEARTVATRGIELGRERANFRDAEFPYVLTYIGDIHAAAAAIEPIVARYRRNGEMLNLAKALCVQAAVEQRRGRYRAALSAASEGLAWSEEVGSPYMVALNLSELVGLEGALALEAAAANADVLEALAPGVGQQTDATLARASLATVALAAGRIDEVIELLEDVRAVMSEQRARFVLWEPDLIEAYARAGRMRDAEELLDAFERAALGVEHAEAIALAASCRALLSDDDVSDDRFADALALLGAGPWPLAVARCELLYGERLRRSGQRAAARTWLRQALARFEELGAHGFVDRARRELQATGEAVRQSSPDARDELTPQERQIAMLVANGATNREVAAGVFLSTKTVEKHLSSVYRKLGVRSRTELAGLLADR